MIWICRCTKTCVWVEILQYRVIIISVCWNTLRQGMKFCTWLFFSIIWRLSRKLLTKSMCPRSWSFLSDIMTCSLSLVWLFSFFICWLYILIYLFLFGRSLIFGLCSNGNLTIVWRLVRSTFGDWFIMSCSTFSLVLLNSIWSWSWHVFYDR